MDSCKKFKDLILTDYIDGEIDKLSKQHIEDHLHFCSKCRLFIEEIEKNVVGPLKKIKPEKVPPQVWSSIEEKIKQKEYFPNPVAEFIQQLMEIFSLPQRAPVLGMLVLLVLGGLMVHHLQIQQAKEKEQGEYMISLIDTTEDSAEAENNDSETSIEKYFL